VLFPTDFSGYADAVLQCLPDLKPAGLFEVVLTNIIRSSDVPMADTINLDSMEQIRWSVQERLAVDQMALEGRGLRVVTRIEYGSPPEEIVRIADEERVQLIIMGAQGMTVAQELLLGTTAYEVVRRASVPVLIQKFDVVRELGHVVCHRVCADTFSRILHPTDFSDCAAEAFQIVKRLKAAGAQEVVVLHVQDERVMKERPAEQLAEFDRHDTGRLEELCRALKLYGLSTRPMLRHGIPFKETLRVADEVEPGLIVLGTHGRSALQEMLAGSTFENVLRLSRYPVLAVRCTPAGSD
jgi:nucleotide-binding universal stress UspA family protein